MDTWPFKTIRKIDGTGIASRCVGAASGLAFAAEVDCGALIFHARRRSCWIDLHPANGIVFFSLHSAILSLFAHLDLYLSALPVSMTKWMPDPERKSLWAQQIDDTGRACQLRFTSVLRLWPSVRAVPRVRDS